MIELTHNMNETIVKSQQAPDLSVKESKMNTIKWKNLSAKYVRQVKTLEAAILQKQQELNKKSKMKGGGYDSELSQLIEPEYTGEENGSGLGLKQRTKAGTKGESFEEFMKRRSKRIGKYISN